MYDQCLPQHLYTAVLTGVACYDGAVCGSTPVHLPSLHACCLTDTSVLKTYKSAGDQSQCDSCLGK